MEARIINRRDLDFVLYEMLGADGLARRPRYREHSRETFSAVLDAALQIASEQFAPHAHDADENEPRLEQGRVVIIPEVKRALQAFCEAGFMSASFDEDLGGMQLPVTVAQAALAIFRGASIGIEAYAMLTIANANLLSVFGSEEQKRRYLPHLLSGRFFGTMCLSEPQAGSSLSLSARRDITTFASTSTAAQAALKMAGRTLSDVQVAEVHDSYSIAEILAVEDLGFCKKGEGGAFVESGATALGGRIPINTSGGLKARGHPLGATGIAQAVEIVYQLRGKAGARQVKDAKVGLTHNVGGTGGTCLVHVLEGGA